jgi:hypothetical protein
MLMVVAGSSLRQNFSVEKSKVAGFRQVGPSLMDQNLRPKSNIQTVMGINV